ncbi:heme ABC transporter ATP-binding protein [Natronosporangium hydrolyticum]|uniref:Heme ABC transporter ATP-binding protein n=1 Tax=Natronosporangium hydrolyticum TaxID=2811111 RepID=A0A895YFU6_9ACTN|nr:heme ABC transporter ATP-binding protein [Natronosporangium hydrolyticum]QSB14283.1 heme ABC transporter ATP-binding protein [Natronosporangium hydrolyticum]
MIGAGRRSTPRWPEPGTVVLNVEQVSVALGGRPVLHDIDLAVRAGEVVALLGPNGAGKSTLVSVIAGETTAASGEVTLLDRPLRSWRPIEQAMRRAVLPQHHHLSFPFPVAAVVRMGRAPWAGTPAEAEDDDAVAAAMAAVDVTELAARPFPSLSGGERARVALARVLAQRTPVVLLDEPTAALDLRHQQAVLQTARRLAAGGVAVVVVLHDLALAGGYADRVVVLDAGRVAAAGPPPEVLTAPLLSAVWRHPVEVLRHPRTGTPLVLPLPDELSATDAT